MSQRISSIILDITDNKVVAWGFVGYGIKSQSLGEIRSNDDLIALGAAHPGVNVMASSSLDFPEEWTKNADTIALARAIRS